MDLLYLFLPVSHLLAFALGIIVRNVSIIPGAGKGEPLQINRSQQKPQTQAPPYGPDVLVLNDAHDRRLDKMLREENENA